jgi:bifunctional non-homologous end joining protein LigD
LLNPIDESEALKLINDDNWCAQEKFDGRRLLLEKKGEAIHGINRRGLIVGLPSPVVVAAQGFNGDFILDGEGIGDRLHVFDMLALDGENLRSKSYQERTAALLNLLASAAWKSNY